MLVRFATLVLAAVCATGCIRSATLITEKPDGTGTIEQTVLMNAAALKGMLGGLGSQPGQGQQGLSEDDWKKAAAKLGEGVTYVSSEPMKSPDGFEGSKAKYAFTDITKLRVNQDPQLSSAGTSGFSVNSKSESPVTFALAQTGGLNTLTVTFNDKPSTAAPKPTGGPDMDNPQMMEIMKTMFKGFKVGIDLEVAGKIVKTNADYVEGSRVTLLEMDLGSLLENEAKLKEVQKAVGPNASIADLKPYLKDLKGLKINDPVVTISFR
jgi:hypothetical protein